MRFPLMPLGLAAAVAVIACTTTHPAAATTTEPVPVVWQDQNTTTCAPDLTLLDHNAAPIWWVLNCGGMWVGDDKLGITGPDVTSQIVYLTPAGGGEVVVNGQTLTAGDIRMLHRLEAAHLTSADLRALARLAQASG